MSDVGFGIGAAFTVSTSVGVAVLIAVLALPSLAWGHIERASYWPDPAPDCAITPCAGGEVPTPRSLASAVARKPAGSSPVTRVVCQPDSFKRLLLSIKAAKTVGYVLRPTQPRRWGASFVRWSESRRP